MGELRIDEKCVRLRPASVDELIDLRHEVLRHALPREEALFDGDTSPDARHYGAFLDGRVVGCATLHLNAWDQQLAWQLRGMATAAAVRGRGVGRAMLRFIEADIDSSPVRLLWANARVPAVGFYQGLGWAVRSEVFEIPTAGPHVKMTRSLPPCTQ